MRLHLIKPAILLSLLVAIDYIYTLQFSPLYKAVLGLISVPLESLLDCSTAELNVQGKEGHTAFNMDSHERRHRLVEASR